MFETKKDYYAAVAKHFQAYQSGGMNVTQATKNHTTVPDMVIGRTYRCFLRTGS